RGQPSEVIPLMAMSSDSKSAVWERLLGSLGLARLAEGQRVATARGAPRLAGIVERVVDKENEELLLRLEEPTSGVAHLLPVTMGGQVCLSVRLFLYGTQARAVAAREAPVWQAWINGLLPPADAATESVANTSSAAPRSLPSLRAARSASSSTTPPRAALTSTASRRMSPSSRGPIMPRVPGPSGT